MSDDDKFKNLTEKIEHWVNQLKWCESLDVFDLMCGGIRLYSIKNTMTSDTICTLLAYTIGREYHIVIPDQEGGE
jgi:hypothetical protein